MAALTPRDTRLLVRYLEGVDDLVTARLSFGFNPHEDHLTALLCEMLDDRQAALSALPYSLDQLRADLAADPRAVRVSLDIEARSYPKHIERKITSSDLGLIVHYVNHVEPDRSFESGALLQAKRLYPLPKTGEYSLDSSFSAFDPEQLSRLVTVEPDGCQRHLCHYLFYCPRPSSYDERTREEVHYRLADTWRYAEYQHRLHFYEAWQLQEAWHMNEVASNPQRHVPGLLVSDLYWLTEDYLEPLPAGGTRVRRGVPKPTARQVFTQMGRQVRPLSWFIVYGMLVGRREGCSEPAGLALVRGAGTQQDSDDPVLPRYVVTVSIEVGSQRG